MKIIAVLEFEINAGGGFNQALNAILQMRCICTGRFNFEVVTTCAENIPYLEKLGLVSHIFAYSKVDLLLRKLSLNDWWQSLQKRIKLVGGFERMLAKRACDLAYFVTPGNTAAGLQKLNFITTIWDLCHLNTPEFPEVRNFNEFLIRERQYSSCLGQSVVVITDSEQLSKFAANRYGIDVERFLSIPFAPSPFLDPVHATSVEVVLNKYNLKEGYFYYPAQFWAHKNHIRILEALLLLKADGWKTEVVFSGRDYGTLEYIETFISQNNLQEQVKILGFVPVEDVRGLYEGSGAVVMPTYFGPTNLPPLESWCLEKPLIYSSHLSEQSGDAALLIDPDNPSELAMAMKQCTDVLIRKRLIEAGRRRLKYFSDMRMDAENTLLKRLEQFAARRRCWR